MPDEQSRREAIPIEVPVKGDIPPEDDEDTEMKEPKETKKPLVS